MNLDQVLTDIDEKAVKEIRNSLESQLHTSHLQSSGNFTSGNNFYNSSSSNTISSSGSSCATTTSSDNGIFTYNSSPNYHQQSHNNYYNNNYHNNSNINSAKTLELNSNFRNNCNSSFQSANSTSFSNNNNNHTINNNIYHQNNNIIGTTANQNNFETASNHLNMPTNEPVKLVYPVSGTATSTNNAGIVTGQAGTQLPNGSISLSQMTSQPQTATIIGSNLVKSGGNTGQTLIIKNPSGSITSAAPGMVTMTKTINNQANLVGTPAMLQAGNIQIVNVRPGAPQAQNHQPKTVAAVQPRVVIGGPQLVGARPANQTITLNTLQNLQQGQPGQTILLKADNGQYQLIRIGPPQQVGPTLTSTANQTIRLQTVPAVSSRFTGPPLALRKTITVSQAQSQAVAQQQQQQPPTGTIIVSSTGTSVTSSVISAGGMHTTPNQGITTGHPSQNISQQQTNNISAQPTIVTNQQQVPATPTTANRTSQDNSKEKCRKFLTNLIELSKREPSSVERNVRTLIQELVDGNVEPEEFCERLERLLNASPQPCLIGFLKKSLPLLRQSLVTKEIVIEGIKAPSASVAFSGTTISTANIPAQIRPVGQVGNIGQTQIRMITQPANAATATVPRIGQTTIRQTTPIRIQGPSPTQIQTPSGPRLITTQLRPGTATIVQNAATGTVTVGSTTIQSTPPALHPVSGIPQSSQIRATKGPLQTQTLQIRTTTNATSTQPVVRVQTAPKSGTPVLRVQTSSSTPQVTVTKNQISTSNSSLSGTNSSGISLITTTTTQNLSSVSSCIPSITTSTPTTLNKSITTKSQQQSSVSSTTLPSSLSTTSSSTSHSSHHQSQTKHTFPKEPKERKTSLSAAAASSYSSMYGDDDINDVAAMGGVNLAEESQRILGQTEFVGTQIRSCKDEVFLNLPALQQKIRNIIAKHGLDEPSNEVAVLVSHATQERLKNIVEKLAVIAEHRIDIIKVDPRYEVTKDVRGQIKFLEDLDKAEQKRHEEQEREMLMRAAKSRSKTEDPEQVKLKQKAKEMQRAEMEELRQRDANLTALQAIGPRKKPRLDGDSTNISTTGVSGIGTINKTTTTPLRPRIKRVNLRDMLFYLEHEKDSCRSTMLYKAYLK